MQNAISRRQSHDGLDPCQARRQGSEHLNLPVSGCAARFLDLLLDLPEPVGRTPSTAICSGLPVHRARAHSLSMGTKSRETIYGGSVRAAAERAAEARKDADRLACEAWNKRMLGFQGPAQPSPTLGDCGLSLSRSEMPWLQHASDGCA